jgi:hypothetical protein
MLNRQAGLSLTTLKPHYRASRLLLACVLRSIQFTTSPMHWYTAFIPLVLFSQIHPNVVESGDDVQAGRL